MFILATTQNQPANASYPQPQNPPTYPPPPPQPMGKSFFFLFLSEDN